MEIEWRDIPGYEGLYKVSEYGDVKSLQRKVKHRPGNTMLIKEKILKPSEDDNGYKSFGLYKNCIVERFSTHILVAIVWNLHKEENHNVVKHLDNIKTNNHYTNLMWDTQSNNSIDAIKDRLSLIGSKHPKAKLNYVQVLDIISSNLKVTDLAKIYNVSHSCISRIKSKKNWKHVNE